MGRKMLRLSPRNGASTRRNTRGHVTFTSKGQKVEALFILLVLAAIGWAIFVQYSSRKQIDILTKVSEQEAAEQVMAYFGALWTQVPGNGHLNYRPKLRMNAPTISVNFSPNGTSECEVSIWTSQFSTRYGLMEHAMLMWRKKRGLTARLTRAEAAANWSRGT